LECPRKSARKKEEVKPGHRLKIGSGTEETQKRHTPDDLSPWKLPRHRLESMKDGEPRRTKFIKSGSHFYIFANHEHSRNERAGTAKKDSFRLI